MNSITLLRSLSKISLYGLVFLIPLWFLPFTQDIVTFQKQALLIVLAFLGLISWLGIAVSERKLVLRPSLLHIPVIVFLVAVGISSLFSLWRYGSLWGWPLDVADSALSVLGFVVLYFLVSNFVEDAKAGFRLLALLLLSGTLAVVFAITQLYGLFLPVSFLQSTAFNTIGSPGGVALVAAVLLPIALALAFSSKMLLRVLLWGLVAALFGALVLLNVQAAWFVLSAELLALLIFGMVNMKTGEFGWVSFPMAFLVIALFFSIFQIAIPGAPSLPAEVSLSNQTEFQLAQEVLKEQPLLGSGPGTFQLVYTQHHSPAVNGTIFWNTRFGSGSAELADWAITTGVLGAVSLLGMILLGIALGVRRLFRQEKDQVSWMIGLGAFSAFVGTVIAFLLSPASFVLWFLFWVFLAMIVVAEANKRREFSIAPPSLLAVASSSAFLVVLIFGLGLLFIGGQKYAAEVEYLKGVRASSQGNVQEAVNRVASAIRLNASADLYWRQLAQLHLLQLNQVSQREDLPQEQRSQEVERAARNAVAAAQRATQISPANVANWNVQGLVYRNLLGAQGADRAAEAAYRKAIDLEPASPFGWTELGRLFLIKSQREEAGKDQALVTAEEHLGKAIELKPDYAPAHYLVAAVRERQGRIEEAIATLEDAKRAAPQDIGLAFQLGSLYRREQDLEKARQEFERALRLNSDYANARYMLGLVYDEQGQKTRALEQFERLAETNPDNGDIRQIIENLRQGNPALEGVASQPPLQEAPPEIQE